MDLDKPKIAKRVRSNRLSLYRTQNDFAHYVDALSVTDVASALEYAKSHALKVYYLGNGSNTFFARSKIASLVIKNRLPEEIRRLDNDRFWVSSSVLIAKILRICQAENRNCFYYLASVPAQVGGAIVMNAGQGKQSGESIFDYVDSVTVLIEGQVEEAVPSSLGVSYRETNFQNNTDQFVIGVTFHFPVNDSPIGQPIKERIDWARENQELSGPNCGSVFNRSDRRIMYRLRGLGVLNASFSRKVDNWIINRNPNPKAVRILIMIVRIAHFLCFKKCKLELRVVK